MVHLIPPPREDLSFLAFDEFRSTLAHETPPHENKEILER
jgi:hypothetical protein